MTTLLINTIRVILSSYDPEKDGDDPITERMLSNHNPELSFLQGTHVLAGKMGSYALAGFRFEHQVGPYCYVIDGLLGEDHNGAKTLTP